MVATVNLNNRKIFRNYISVQNNVYKCKFIKESIFRWFDSIAQTLTLLES